MSIVEEGLTEISAGAQDLVAARKMRRAGATALAAGSSDVTHGVDKMIVADKLAKLSEVLAVAGAADVAQSVEALATSEDIDVQSALVGMLSAEDIAHAMELGAVSGQLAVASDIVEAREMPALAAFLEDKGILLRTFAVDSIMRAAATRALAQATAAIGTKVSELDAYGIVEDSVQMAALEAGAFGVEVIAYAEMIAYASDRPAGDPTIRPPPDLRI